MEKLMQFMVFLVTFQSLVNNAVQAEYNPFDFFWFSLSWPSSLCNVGKRCAMYPVPGDFTIHGLWPDNYNGPYLSDCYKEPYNTIQDRRLRGIMSAVWPNVKSRGNDGFWAYEWEKHGVCARFWYEQNPYFRAGTKLKETYKDLLVNLQTDGIVPGPGNAYSLDQIWNAVKTITGTYPDLACNKDRNGNFQLLEIRICIHSDGRSAIDCPADRSSRTCSSAPTVYFPLMT